MNTEQSRKRLRTSRTKGAATQIEEKIVKTKIASLVVNSWRLAVDVYIHNGTCDYSSCAPFSNYAILYPTTRPLHFLSHECIFVYFAFCDLNETRRKKVPGKSSHFRIYEYVAVDGRCSRSILFHLLFEIIIIIRERGENSTHHPRDMDGWRREYQSAAEKEMCKITLLLWPSDTVGNGCCLVAVVDSLQALL